MQDNVAKTAAEWVFVARSVAKLPDGHDQALRYMSQAATLAQDVDDWLAVATAWQQDFGNSDLARQCMSMAESCAEKSSYPYAREQNSTDWIALARTWDQVFDEHDIAQQWMEKVDALAEESFDIHHWINLAKVWKNKFRDRGKGIECLNMAENVASSCHDWIEMAQIWKGSFRNRKNGIRCLKNAEEAARHSYELMSLVEIWNKDFRDPDNGTRCLEEAEVLADNSQDWTRIAKVWKDLFRNSDKGIQCLKEAEASATSASDWGNIGWTWGGTFGDSDNQNRCLRIAYGDVRQHHVWGSTYDAFEEALIDQRSRQRGGVSSLGFLERSPKTFNGTWGDECVSERRPGSYARYYSFSLGQAAVVVITLEPKEETYLYLMWGESTSSIVIAQSSDTDYEKLNLLNSRDAQILRSKTYIVTALAAGTYTVEATTSQGEEAGPFSLKLQPIPLAQN